MMSSSKTAYHRSARLRGSKRSRKDVPTRLAPSAKKAIAAGRTLLIVRAARGPPSQDLELHARHQRPAVEHRAHRARVLPVRVVDHRRGILAIEHVDDLQVEDREAPAQPLETRDPRVEPEVVGKPTGHRVAVDGLGKAGTPRRSHGLRIRPSGRVANRASELP